MGEPNAKKPGKTRILIIDDDPTLCKLLTQIFEDLQYEVEVAHDGAEGIEAASQNLPDLAIVDINMPKMNGYEVCSRLRAEPSTRYVPILMLTGVSHLPSAMKGLASGANDYITKPFNIDEITARVQALLQRQL